MFCVECGSEERLYGHLCKKCLLSKDLVRPPEHITVQVCQGCGRVLEGAAWKMVLPDSVAASQLEAGTRKHDQVSSVRWQVPYIPPEKGEHKVLCTATATIEGDELALDHEVAIRVRFGSCPSCSRQAGDYYEAILQLRMEGLSARDAEVELAEEHAMVLRMVDEFAETDEKAFLSKESAVQGGIDYYMGSMAMARSIATKLRSYTGASLNESPSIVGQKDGVDVYRNSILVKLPVHREGDVVAFGKKLHVVEASDSKMLTLKSAINGQIIRVRADDGKLRQVARYRDLREAVVVTYDGTTVQVLDPDSMVSVTLHRPPYLKRLGETVSVVRYDDMLYIV